MSTPPLTLVFGGSFDPPHAAHVALPKHAADAVGATSVLYIPAAKAPHKMGQAQTPGHHRLAMLQLALRCCPWAGISAIELERAQTAPDTPSYTVDTLAELKAQFPERRWRLLIGSDQLRIFPSWRNWRQVADMAEPVVMVRAPHTANEVMAQLPAELNPEEWRPRLVPVPALEVSSTDIRQRVAAGDQRIDHLLAGVAAYIQEHGLYR